MNDADPEYQQNPLSSAYVASFGINPNRMRLDGWDETGYFAYDSGADPYGEGPIQRHRWPEGFEYPRFLDPVGARRAFPRRAPSRHERRPR